MPLMGLANLSIKLGEHILEEDDVAYDKVLHVDFYVDWFNGTDATPGETDYPVKVTYTVEDGERTYTKTYKYMSDVINALEDVEDDLRHS